MDFGVNAVSFFDTAFLFAMTSKTPRSHIQLLRHTLQRAGNLKWLLLKNYTAPKAAKQSFLFFQKRACRVFGQAYGKIADICNIIFLKNKYFSHKKYKKIIITKRLTTGVDVC